MRPDGQRVGRTKRCVKKIAGGVLPARGDRDCADHGCAGDQEPPAPGGLGSHARLLLVAKRCVRRRRDERSPTPRADSFPKKQDEAVIRKKSDAENRIATQCVKSLTPAANLRKKKSSRRHLIF